MTAAERVARGAALLDDKRPGWKATDRREAWIIAAPLFFFHARELAAHGFEIELSTAHLLTAEESRAANGELDELWIAEIRRRLDAAGAP